MPEENDYIEFLDLSSRLLMRSKDEVSLQLAKEVMRRGLSAIRKLKQKNTDA